VAYVEGSMCFTDNEDSLWFRSDSISSFLGGFTRGVFTVFMSLICDVFFRADAGATKRSMLLKNKVLGASVA